MVTRVVNNFFVSRFFSSFVSLLSPSLHIFLVAPSFFFGKGHAMVRCFPVEGLTLLFAVYGTHETHVTGSSDTKLCVVFRETWLCVIYSFIGEQQEVLYAR